jgi:hypothetical protein
VAGTYLVGVVHVPVPEERVRKESWEVRKELDYKSSTEKLSTKGS